MEKEKFGKGIQYLRDINKYVIQNATQKDIEEVISTNEKIKRYTHSVLNCNILLS